MTDLSNNFYQLNPANSSGDYLTLKKSKLIFAIDNKKPKVNTNKILSSKDRSFQHRFLFNKGLFQNTVCTRGVIASGKMTGALTLAAGSSSVNNYYKNKLITITAGTANGDSRTITSYNGANRTFTVDNDFSANTDNTSVYTISVDNSTYPYSRVEVDANNKLEF